VNIVLGAVNIHLRDFVLGSLIGIAPGILIVSLFEYQIEAVIRNPHAGNVLLLASLAAGVPMLFVWLRRRLRRVAS
jgi:uncharacterized membrane protein YdjX (TVP38/TMEM64 family)